MPIKLAFSTAAAPQWTIAQVAQQAKALGFAGVEVRTLFAGASALASDPAHVGAGPIRAALSAAGIEAVCLSTAVSLHQWDAGGLEQSKRDLTTALDTAVALGAKAIRVWGLLPPTEPNLPEPVRKALALAQPGRDVRSMLSRIVGVVRPIADRAGELGVQVLLENSPSLTNSREWWWVMDLIDHPMVGLCWDPATAYLAGEKVAVSVTTLNSRIRLVRLRDVTGATAGTKNGKAAPAVGDRPALVAGDKAAPAAGGKATPAAGGSPATMVPPGAGAVGLEALVKRLLGIGYDGYVILDWDRLAQPALAPAEDFLPPAQARVKGWLDAVAKSLEPPTPTKAAPAKPKPAAVAGAATTPAAAAPTRPAGTKTAPEAKPQAATTAAAPVAPPASAPKT